LVPLALISGLPHTQGIQGILIYFLNSGKLREVLIFSNKFREVLKFFKSQDILLLYLERDFINLVHYFVQEINFS